MELIPGRTVSHYELLEKLGAGGMGEIYKARDSRLNRIVAVKVLTQARTRDPQRRRRFIQEAQAASGLNHPNIITIHDILSEGDTQYMVMEHVAGETVYALIAAGPMPLGQVFQIGAQIANALAAAHAAGIIHRDLKPANVMVTGSGLVKVLDFGLAKLTDPPGTSMQSPTVNGEADSSATLTAAPISASPLTAEGSIMGTVNYMSPEQAEGLKVDARSDIFSFGAVFYEMITGQRAFEGDSGISTLSAVLRDEVKPIRETVPDIPPEVEDLVARCLRKSPAERWASMGEVASALTRLRARLESGSLSAPSAIKAPDPAPIETAKPAPPPPAATAAPASRMGTRTLIVAAFAVVLVAAVMAGIWWRLHRASQAPQATTAAVAPSQPQSQPAPTPEPPPAPAAPSPAPAPEAKQDTFSSAPAPPPPTSVVPLPGQSKALAPPTVAAAPAIKNKGPVQPQPAPVSSAAAPVARAQTEMVEAKLTDGIPFRIALEGDVSVSADVGQALRFRVLDGLEANGVTVIAKGSMVTGSVAALAGKKNFFGQSSKVQFQLSSAVSVDDGEIKVRATPSAHDGAETRPFVTPKGAPKDKNLIAAGGTEYVAYVAGDQTVRVHK